MNIKPGYHPLAAVLQMALNQAQEGKGAVRHANGQPFLSQPIMEIGRMVGNGYQLGQAMKKAQESTRLPWPAAQRELLGAINYLAAAYLDIGERNGDPITEEFQANISADARPETRRGEKEVYAFAEAMIATLNLPKNAQKEPWEALSLLALIKRTHEELNELEDEIYINRHKPELGFRKVIDVGNDRVKAEATDLANFAMFIFSYFNRKEQAP